MTTAVSSATGTSSALTSAAAAQTAYDKTNTTALPTTAANGTAIAATAQSAATALSGNYQTFMKLLTAQLKNQDPTQPTDTAAFTQQLVQYSQVEQQISSNSKLDSILAGITGQSATQYVNYIGKDVSVNTDQLQLSGSAANIGYTLPDAAKSVSIDILDKNKNTVATFTGDTTVGAHSYVWDGTAKDGSTLADGAYSFKVTAMDSSGNALANVTQSFTGLVSSIKSSASGTTLSIGDMSVSPSDVTAVSAGVTYSKTSSTDSSTTSS